MNRKLLLSVFTIASLGNVLYFAYEFLMWDKTWEGEFEGTFITIYLDNLGKYFNVLGVILLLFVFATKLPYMDSMYKTRYKNRLFHEILLSSIIKTIYFSLWITFIYSLAAIFVDSENVTVICILNIFSRVFVLALQFILLFHLIYIISCNLILSWLAPYICNLLAMLFINSVIPFDEQLRFMVFYCICVSLISPLVFRKVLKQKECLK